MKIRERIKKYICIVLACIITVFNIPFSVFAANSGTLKYDRSVGWSFGGTSWGEAGLMTINGSVVYCLQPSIEFAEGATYSPSEDFSSLGISQEQKIQLSLLAYFAKQRAIQTGNKDWYAIGGNAVWKEIGQYTGWTVSPTFDTKSKIDDAVQQLYDDVERYHKRPSFHNTTVDIKVGQTVRLTDTNGVIGTFKVVASDGLQTRIEGNDLVVTATSDSAENATISFVKNISAADTGVSLMYSSGNAQKVGMFRVGDPNSGYVKFDVEKYGSLKLAKKDEDGKFVPNTTFKISYSSNMSSPIGEYTTGSDGTVTINNLLPQTVYIQEKSVPSHLVLDTTVRSVTIKPNETVTYTATNEWKQGKVKLKKTDEDTGTQVGGAVYGIFDSSGREVQRLTTTASGYVFSNYMRHGNYTLKELIPPEGFVLNTKVYNISITEDEQVIEVNATDRPIKGYIQVVKKDVDSGKTIVAANTTFNVHKKDGTIIDTITTDSTGKAKIQVRYGEYYLTEKTPPTNYTGSSKKLTYTVSEDGKTYSAEFSNKRVTGTINLTKVDSVTGGTPQGEASLKGAVYDLYARENILDPADGSVIYKAGAKVTSLVTDSAGKASVSNLYLGKFYLKERTPSPGYTLDETEYDITLSYESPSVSVVTKNQTVKERVISQAFSIIKISDNGTGEADILEGIEFTVKSQKDIEKYGSWEAAPIAKNAQGKTSKILVTDKNGYAVSDEYPYGVYVVRETLCKDGLLKVDDFTVTINEDSREPQPWRVFNDGKMKAVIKMVKKDADTGKIVQVEGATFKIKNLTTNEYLGYWEWNPIPHYVDEWTTTADGIVLTGDEITTGVFQLEEFRSPEGYLLDIEPVRFEITNGSVYETLPDGVTAVITVEKSDPPAKGIINVEKKGEVLTGFENGNFVYEERSLAGMTANIYAKEDILDPADGSVVYAAGTLVDTVTTNGVSPAQSKPLFFGVYEIREATAPGGMTINTTPQTVEIKYKDQNTAIVYENVTFHNDRQKVNAKLQKVDEETSEGLSGAEFALRAKNDIQNIDGETIVKAGTVLNNYVSGEDGNLNINIDLPLGHTFELYETKAPVGHILNDRIIEFTTEYKGQDIPNYDIILGDDGVFGNAKIRGSIAIQKKDSNDDSVVLSGVPFNISLNEDMSEVIATELTNESGVALFENYEYNTYYIQEAEQVGGYIINDTIYKAEITENGKIITIEVNNTPTETHFQKVDENENGLAGAVLQVVGAKTKNIVDKWTSTGEPHTIQYLVEGETYILQELSAPTGRLIADDIEFVAENGMTITMKDELILTDIQVNKVDSVTKEPIKHEDFEFTMYADEACTQVLDVVNADKETGTATFKDVPFSTVYIKETQAPTAYGLSDEVKKIVIDENLEGVGDVHSFVYENAKILTDIQVNKVDSVTKEPIKHEDFEFTMYADEACTQVLDVVNADKETGTATFKDVPFSTVYIKETQAPTAYGLSDEVKKIVIDENLEGVGDVHSFVYENAKILTDIQVNKVDSVTKEPIKHEDFEFTMYADEACTQVLDVVNADKETGTATFKDVPFSTVYIKETKAPKGYGLSDEVKKIVIDENLEGVGDVHSFVYENVLLPAVSVSTGDNSGIMLAVMASIFVVVIGCVTLVLNKARKNG